MKLSVLIKIGVKIVERLVDVKMVQLVIIKQDSVIVSLGSRASIVRVDVKMTHGVSIVLKNVHA